jgi:type IV secretion system protein VirB10
VSAAAIPRFTAAVRGRKPLPVWARTTLLGGTIVGCTLGLAWLFVGSTAKPPPDKAVHSDWAPGAPISVPVADDEAPPKPAVTAAAPPAPAAASTLPGPAATPAPGVRVMQVWGDSGSPLTQHAPAAPTGGYGIGGSPPPYNAAYPPAAPAPPGDGAAVPGSDYASRLNPTQTQGTDAVADQDISLLLAETTSFGCLPNSPIDTQLVGGVSCTVSENVWSADGSTILIDRLATVSGEIQRGLELGQDRAFILWRSVRSKHVRATLNSPATDALGQMGAPGELVTHLWDKIKGTLMLTGIETAGNTAQALASRGNGNSYVNFSQGQSLASQELQHNINIPNTLWRGQAWPLRVYVQHDIKFHRAYNNVLVAGQQ